jgi:hypothetical protein
MFMYASNDFSAAVAAGQRAALAHTALIITQTRLLAS